LLWKSASAPSASSTDSVAALHQGLDVELAHAAPLGDGLVHQRLGVAGVVAFVVAVAAVADHVDDHVLVEPLAVLEGQLGHPHAGLGVVAVHVEDGRLHRLGHIAAVQRLRECCGLVVKPIWLLMMRWMVPPTR
jgi:hypothetical protein